MDEQKKWGIPDDAGLPADELDLDEFRELAGMNGETESEEPALREYKDTSELLEDFREFTDVEPPPEEENTADLLSDFKEFAAEYFDPVTEDDVPAASAQDFDPDELNRKLRELELEEPALRAVDEAAAAQEAALSAAQEAPAAPQPKPEKPVKGVEKKEKKKAVKVQRRQKTGCFGAILFFAFVVGVSTLLAVLGWMAARDVLALGKEDLTAVVEVAEGDTVNEISEKLHDAGLVEYPFLFRLYGKFADIDEEHKISVGTFELNTSMDYRALVTAMNTYSDNRMTVTLTFPEGYDLRQIVALMADNGVAAEEDLWKTLSTYDFEYSFLADLPLGENTRLEGYLFPDKYEFYISESTVTAINKMLSNFNSKFTEEMRQRAEEMGYSVHEILTVASMIEREAANDSERATIASVIYNRLNDGGFPYLQIDATVQYALGEHKEVLTQADLEVDSPYNTYLYPGLPPGPIASPGLKSIQAALYPEVTGYYYYALNENGTHNFFSNYQDFENFIAVQDYSN